MISDTKKFKELIIQRMDCLLMLETLAIEANGETMTIEQTKKFLAYDQKFKELTVEIDALKVKFEKEKRLWEARHA